VLDYALELQKQLEASGDYRVLLTRDSDIFIQLRDRYGMAEEAGADPELPADPADHPPLPCTAPHRAMARRSHGNSKA